VPAVGLPAVPAAEVVALINGFGSRPRTAAGEADDPYPDPAAALPSLPGLEPDEAVRQADRLWPVFAADPAEAAELLSGLAGASRLAPLITADGTLGWSTGRSGGEAERSAALVAAVLDVVRQTGWSRVGSCQAVDCVDVYIDSGRRHPRRYCSDTCLNRTRVRNHRKAARG
jgi:hypothetical protein